MDLPSRYGGKGFVAYYVDPPVRLATGVYVTTQTSFPFVEGASQEERDQTSLGGSHWHVLMKLTITIDKGQGQGVKGPPSITKDQ